MEMNEKKSLILVLIILFISVGFAILATQLDIKGTTTIVSNKWDIHFENIQVRGKCRSCFTCNRWE